MSSGNFLFTILLLLGPLVRVSSSNWVICWVGLELSFLGVIPLLLRDRSFLSLRKESVIKYFCIQALGSGLLILGGVLFYIIPEVSEFSDLLFVRSLFIKLGVFPIHFWVPRVTSGLNWFPLFLLLGWQKIPPFIFLVNISENSHWLGRVITILGGVRAMVGAIIGLNQTSFRAILGGSSIVHTGWGCIGSVFGGLWFYFTVYCLSFGILMLFCSLEEHFITSLRILSLRGLPPSLIFIGKWRILKRVFYRESSSLFLILPIARALLRLFFYLKFFYSFYLRSRLDSRNLNYRVWGCLSFVRLIGVTLCLLL